MAKSLVEWSRKQRWQVDLEFFGHATRVPLDQTGDDFRTLIIVPPSLNQSSVHVDDPVLRDSLALVPLSFHAAIQVDHPARRFCFPSLGAGDMSVGAIRVRSLKGKTAPAGKCDEKNRARVRCRLSK